uniref:SERTA domain containing 2b n=1 Tax=Scleropages formosus TaxID=113540 RepID=A0A8C9V9J8_SCLFO
MAQRVVTPYPATVPPTVSDVSDTALCSPRRYMLGKGAKRKHEENEDELEGAAPAPASGEPADGPSKASYTLQRQTIFNMSLMKLYSQRAPADASLERRVLINNMLRRIQDELKQEGALRPLLLPASSPPEDPLCPATATTSPSDGTPSAPLSTEAQSKDKNGSQRPGGSASPAEERTSAADPAPPNGLDMSPSAPPSSSPSSSSGFLTDLALDDILFADIDTSMYDFDPCTSGAGAGPPKVAPVVTADDLVKTLSPYSGGSPSSGPSQPFKMDLAELDHIMEVLVGS